MIIEKSDLQLVRPYCCISNPEAAREALMRLKRHEKPSEWEEIPSTDDSEMSGYEQDKDATKEEMLKNLEDDTAEDTIQVTVDAVKEKVSQSPEKKQQKIPLKLDFGRDNVRKLRNMVDFWRSANFNRRLDAAEDSIDKMSQVLDQLINRFDDLDVFRDIGQKIQDLELQISRVEKEAEKKPSFSELSDKIVELFGENKPQYLLDLERDLEELRSNLKHLYDQTGVAFLSEEDEEHHVKRNLVNEMKHRFEDVWDQLNKCNAFLEKFNLDDATIERLVGIERIMRKISDDLQATKNKTEFLDAERRMRAKDLETIQSKVKDHEINKVGREEFEDQLKLKADKRELTLKVDKDDFNSCMDEFGDFLKDFQTRLEECENSFEMLKKETAEELLKKLNINDYETLQKPLWNRLRSIMHGFKKMKSLLVSLIYPEAAGVTKCISCGKKAELTGKLFAESDDIPPYSQMPKSSDNFRLADLRPLDPKNKRKPPREHGGHSYISLPVRSAESSPTKESFRSPPYCYECGEPDNKFSRSGDGKSMPSEQDGKFRSQPHIVDLELEDPEILIQRARIELDAKKTLPHTEKSAHSVQEKVLVSPDFSEVDQKEPKNDDFIKDYKRPLMSEDVTKKLRSSPMKLAHKLGRADEVRRKTLKPVVVSMPLCAKVQPRSYAEKPQDVLNRVRESTEFLISGDKKSVSRRGSRKT